MSNTNKDTTAADRHALDGTREITEALYRSGLIDEADASAENALRGEVGAKALRLQRDTFDVAQMTPTRELAPEAIRSLREREGVSQAVLAMHLGVATATLSQWERGLRKPEGPALRLLTLIERNGLAYVR